MNIRPHKKHIERIINLNPSKVLIARPEKIDLGYGSYRWEISDVGEENIYICFNNDRFLRTYLHDHGQHIRDNPDLRFIALPESKIETGDILNDMYQVSYVFSCHGIAKQGGLVYYEK